MGFVLLWGAFAPMAVESSGTFDIIMVFFINLMLLELLLDPAGVA